MFERIKTNYTRNWVTKNQLERYVILGVITEKQASEIRQTKLENV